jgi:hypothetical protein
VSLIVVMLNMMLANVGVWSYEWPCERYPFGSKANSLAASIRNVLHNKDDDGAREPG